MIEATCAACGTLNRIAEADVPTGAKFVTCASCKSRVALPTKTVFGTPKVPASIPPIPKPPATPRAIDLADLPAPKRTSPLAGAEPSKPAPKSALTDADLPAPKPTLPVRPITTPLGLDDMMPEPAPPPSKTKAMPDNLPAPKAKPPATPVARPTPLPASTKGIVDLPAPKPGANNDLLTPKGKPAAPAAAPKPPAAKPRPEIVDLLAPKGPSDIIDLPTPKAAPDILDLPVARPGITELPMPRPSGGGSSDLPAPKGFFDDLPQPARTQPGGGIDLPAPKGFFEDLPQPSRNQDRPEVPAPKGFFDDLPQVARNQDRPEVPAPKGFFDDLPQPSRNQDQTGLLEPQRDNPDLVAPKGFFDDLPLPSKPAPGLAGSRGDFSAGSDLDLSPSTAGDRPLDLDDGPDLDLGLAKPSATSRRHEDLELAEATAKAGIKIATPSNARGKGKGDGAALTSLAPSKGGDLTLELEEPRGAAATKAAAKKPAKATEPAVDPRAKSRRTKILLGVVLAVAAAGGGGFYLYQRHVAQQARADEITTQLATASKALTAGDPNHWQRAATAAKAVLELDDTNAKALGVGAEALLAGALDTGVNGPARIAQGRSMLAKALEAGVSAPELARAQALGAIVQNQAERAVTKLEQLSAAQPNNGFLLLYLGWAQLARGDAAAALKSFDQAVAKQPEVKLAALYGHGRAKLLLADLDGARTDFTTILDQSKDHIGAMVGLAATLQPSQGEQREKDLLAILARKDIATADPRAVVQAWTLAADVARLGGRLDVARDRYQKAIALAPTNPTALTGLAAVELRAGKPAVAADLIQKALAGAGDDPDALLVGAEVAIRQGKVGDASAVVKKLAARTPPLPPLQQAHLAVITGKLLEIQGQDDAAVDAYVAGAKIASELDLTPTIAAVTKLAALAKHATEIKDDAAAKAYRDRADALLSALADRAKDDAQLAMTLGVAYLDAGDAAKAVTFLRRAVDMRGSDVDARVELAKALTKHGDVDDAVDQLKAASQLDPARADILLELALTYEAAGKTAEIAAAYDQLLAAKDVTVAARVHAGRYFARTGQIAKAGDQAAPILAAEPDNAGGHYLKGELLLSQGNLDGARKELQQSSDADPDPQYLDALGRAYEASIAIDSKYLDGAIRAYDRAHEADPTMINPLAGSGRLYVASRQWSKSFAPLLAANKLDPRNGEVMFNMGVALQAQARKQDAIKWLESAAAARPSHAETFYRLGQLYNDGEINNLGRAIRSYDQATRLGAAEETRTGKPVTWDLTEAWYQLGDSYVKQGGGGWKRAWEQYMNRNPPVGAQTDHVRYALQTGEVH